MTSELASELKGETERDPAEPHSPVAESKQKPLISYILFIFRPLKVKDFCLLEPTRTCF